MLTTLALVGCTSDTTIDSSGNFKTAKVDLDTALIETYQQCVNAMTIGVYSTADIAKTGLKNTGRNRYSLTVPIDASGSALASYVKLNIYFMSIFGKRPIRTCTVTAPEGRKYLEEFDASFRRFAKVNGYGITKTGSTYSFSTKGKEFTVYFEESKSAMVRSLRVRFFSLD
ncbi:hypothetical protein [Martelella mediterranea]|uniref:hypothetical protein n=1 Tax=Martelella mediterranea TaxID=293089 RepID=UPI0003775A6F|nr:hypothetical protein [Martelella mediterranea]